MILPNCIEEIDIVYCRVWLYMIEDQAAAFIMSREEENTIVAMLFAKKRYPVSYFLHNPSYYKLLVALMCNYESLS